MWSAPRGNPAARIPGDLVATPRRSSSGTRRRRAAWARNAPFERLRNQQRMLATDMPTTLLEWHDPLRTSSSECRPGTDRCSLPLLPYLRWGTAPGTERLVGNWGRSDGLPPVLRAWRRVRLGASLLSKLGHPGSPVPSTFARSPCSVYPARPQAVQPVAQFANRLREHARIAGAAAFSSPYPSSAVRYLRSYPARASV